MTISEAIHDCNFGAINTERAECYLICDDCNELLNVSPLKYPIIYYVAALNCLFCAECYKKMVCSCNKM